jgi:protein tyrosine/serine phosphatase
VQTRNLAWDGCVNVRDLGGHPTEDGSTTRVCAVVRADSVRKLSDEGWAAAVAYGITTVLDLRFHEELEADPPGDVPIDVVHLSLFGEPDAERWADLDRRAAAAGDDVAATRLVYLETLEEHRDELAAAMRIVADAPPGGLLVHCTGGKDRTGLVSALLLRLAGVAPEEIADDYALSEVNLAERHAQWLADAADDEERERLRRIGRTPAQAMLGVLEELEARYGSVAEYLRAGGATDADLERARARLRD